MLDRYVAQVRLLLSALQDVANETVFALKGGTAINLFYRDMPRLSVDIDLTYLPVADRQSSLKGIDDALGRIMVAIARRDPRIEARRVAGGGNADTRIMVSDGQVQIKIETSPVTRGAVYPARTMITSEAVTEQFGFVETTVLAFEDLYGGKLHAALDRQHPRDLFDVMLLFENEGLTADLFRAFLVYVASSGRPMHELLAPAAPLREQLYGEEFEGMTRHPVSLGRPDQNAPPSARRHWFSFERRCRDLPALASRCGAGLPPDRLAPSRRPPGSSLEADQPGQTQAGESPEA